MAVRVSRPTWSPSMSRTRKACMTCASALSRSWSCAAMGSMVAGRMAVARWSSKSGDMSSPPRACTRLSRDVGLVSRRANTSGEASTWHNWSLVGPLGRRASEYSKWRELSSAVIGSTAGWS
ncbi:hypothetical protein BCR44DRAFT_1270402 [Catenaria anguillulae PL171]|uniref:Uncharacterized protein n=1 Tax=Catenaria anguillulae PL171 TaxID=765915 RepID=A0A1Y2HZU8_9FUNG|nr:hypothetical protein BCR44DRAFT_1270402 [Catenaria anguillulae PL171]